MCVWDGIYKEYNQICVFGTEYITNIIKGMYLYGIRRADGRCYRPFVNLWYLWYICYIYVYMLYMIYMCVIYDIYVCYIYVSAIVLLPPFSLTPPTLLHHSLLPSPSLIYSILPLMPYLAYPKLLT